MDDNTATVLTALLVVVGLYFILSALRKKKRFSLDLEGKGVHLHANASDSETPQHSIDKE